MRIISWFSCGAASTVASKLAIDKYENCDVIYCDTGSEHKDNIRFLYDVQKWLGKEIKIYKNDKYENIWDVFRKTKYLVGIRGARCTVELKKKIRHDIESKYDKQIFGYTAEEVDRAERLLEQNPEVYAEFPLIDNQLTKKDCLAIINEQNIELPAMYKLGYRNNNCIGCVKGQQGYWNKIRKDFPDIFNRMANIERELGVAINKSYKGDGKRKRVFLDELNPSDGRYETEPDISCGIMCQITLDSFEQKIGAAK